MKPDINTGFPITQCVVEGIQQGRVFDIGGGSYFILHKTGFGSLVNAESCDRYKLLDLFLDKSIPQYFHIYDASDDLIEYLKGHDDLFNLRIRPRCVLQYLEKSPLKFEVPKGYSIGKIDADNFCDISNFFPLDLGSRFWNGSDNFVENSLSVVVFSEDGEPVGICYSAATCTGRAEVDIWIAENHRNLGLAKLVTKVFVNVCLKHKIIPNWDSFEGNINSLKTALSLSFNEVRNYIFLSIFMKNEKKSN